MLLCLDTQEAQATSSNLSITDSLQAIRLERKLDSFMYVNMLDSALTYTALARQIYVESQAWQKAMSLQNRVAKRATRKERLDQALELLLNARDIGRKHYYPNEDVLKKIDKKKPHPPLLLLADIYNNISRVYFKKGNYDLAARFLSKTLVIKEHLLGKNSEEVGLVFFEFGSIHYFMDNFKKALVYNQKGLNIQLQNYYEDHTRLIKTYKNIANIYTRLDDKENALKYYQKTRDILEKNGGIRLVELHSAYTNIALTYEKLARYDEAIASSLKALDLLAKVYERQHPDFANNYLNIGNIYLQRQLFDSTELYYNKALECKQFKYPNNHPEVMDVYLRLGNLSKKKKDYQEALSRYDEVIKALTGDSERANMGETVSLTKVSSYVHLLEAFNAKAQVLQQIFEETNEWENVVKALDTYQEAASLIDTIHVISRAHLFKELPEGIFEETYYKGVQLAFQLYENVKSEEEKKKCVMIAFGLVEKSRKSKLIDAINSINLRHFHNISDSLVNAYNTINTDIGYNKAQLLKADPQRLKKVSTKLTELSQQKKNLLDEIQHNYPDYYNLRYDFSIANINEVSALLQNDLPNTAIIEFFTNDTLGFVFTLTAKGVYMDRFEIHEELETNYLNFMDFISNKEETISKDMGGYRIYRNNVYKLFEALLKKPLSCIEKDVTDLLIIPDGKFTCLPFEALSTKDLTLEDRVSYQNIPYLLNDYQIYYAYGVSFFMEDLQKQRETSGQIYCGWSVPYEYNQLAINFGQSVLSRFNNNEEETLPKSRQEIGQTNAVMKGEVFIESDANETNFKETGTGALVNHLALNCLVSNQKPMDTKLLFAVSNSDKEDDIFNIYELYNTPMKSNLAVLSATFPTSEEVNQVDGYLNLSRAFAYAGTPSLITTLWRSEDVAPEIMVYFFDKLSKGTPVAESLRHAKLEIINQSNPRKAHPYFWAGMISVGNPKPVVNQIVSLRTWLSLFAGILTILIIIGMIYWYFVERTSEE